MDKRELLYKFYNNEIQLHKNVIDDIIDECMGISGVKMLVFGLGYDSKLWYNLTNTNTFFVENDKSFVKLNSDIKHDNIIIYNYKDINVMDSYEMSLEKIESYGIPDELLKMGKFDVIIIDGPRGYKPDMPGRLLPIYWSKYYLSKSGTIIYVDDANRELEKKCIQRFLINNRIKSFSERLGCDKFIM